jgi:hypothetical protein
MKQTRHTNHFPINTPLAPAIEARAFTHTNRSSPQPEHVNDPLAQLSKGQKPEANRQFTPHPALTALARLLGRQAAMHVRKYRFEGLGHIQIILREAGMSDDV